MSDVETTTAAPITVVTFTKADIFTYAWVALPIMDFTCGVFNRHYYLDDASMPEATIKHVYLTEMVGGAFQALTWALGVFWENADSQLVFENTSKAHLLFELFMAWQQYHANKASDYSDSDEWPTVTKIIIGAHLTGVLIASAEQKFIA